MGGEGPRHGSQEGVHGLRQEPRGTRVSKGGFSEAPGARRQKRARGVSSTPGGRVWGSDQGALVARTAEERAGGQERGRSRCRSQDTGEGAGGQEEGAGSCGEALGGLRRGRPGSRGQGRGRGRG